MVDFDLDIVRLEVLDISDRLEMLLVLDIVEFGDMVYLEGLISAIVDKDMRELFL